jgi:hypothetical protein
MVLTPAIQNDSLINEKRKCDPLAIIYLTEIPLGLVGSALLLAMWMAHLALFHAIGLAGWVVVVPNFIGLQFNSHLFDFTHGWVYVLGVDIAGGVALKKRAASPVRGDAC